MSNKKGQLMSGKVIAIIIAVVVLVILLVFYTGQFNKLFTGINVLEEGVINATPPRP